MEADVWDSQVKKNILLRFHVGNFNFHVEKAKRLLMRGQHLQKTSSSIPEKEPVACENTHFTCEIPIFIFIPGLWNHKLSPMVQLKDVFFANMNYLLKRFKDKYRVWDYVYV